MRFYHARKQINEKQIKQSGLALIDAVQFADLHGCYFYVPMCARVDLSPSLKRTYAGHFYWHVLEFHVLVGSRQLCNIIMQ